MGTAASIASSYFRKPCTQAELVVKWGGTSHKTQTDNFGSFVFESDRPFDEKSDLELFLSGGPLPYDRDTYHVHFINSKGFLVISDIDDTVLVSHTNTRLKRLMTTLFKPFEKRKPVRSTSRILDSLGRHDNDFVYVSRSEFNLFPLLSDFMRHHRLPYGPLFLTPFFSFRELLRNKKDPGFKVNTINFLMAHSPHHEVVLLGDDTQHDLEVYSEMAKVHAPRVRQVYIRQTDQNQDKRHSEAWQTLNAYAEKVVYFNDSMILTSDTP